MQKGWEMAKIVCVRSKYRHIAGGEKNLPEGGRGVLIQEHWQQVEVSKVKTYLTAKRVLLSVPVTGCRDKTIRFTILRMDRSGTARQKPGDRRSRLVRRIEQSTGNHLTIITAERVNRDNIPPPTGTVPVPNRPEILKWRCMVCLE